MIGALFVALGGIDLYLGVAPLLHGAARLAGDDWLVLGLGAAALAGGLCLIAGHNWARWLLVAWMALHVPISAGQPVQLLIHAAIFGLLAFTLFRGRAAEYFRRGPAAGPA